MNKIRFEVKGEKYNIPCLAYETSGKSCGAVVCLHGFGGDKESSAIKKLAELVETKGYAVVCFDFPAHGKSEAADNQLTVENCVNDAGIISAYAENKYGKIGFFATSFGAYILVNMLKTLDFKGVRAVLRSPAVKMEKTFLSPICNLTDAELERVEKVECGFDRKIKLGYEFYTDLLNHEISEAKFENETLLIYGDRDDVVVPSDMAEFAAARENITEKIIVGADHRYKRAGQLEEAISAAAEFLTEEEY